MFEHVRVVGEGRVLGHVRREQNNETLVLGNLYGRERGGKCLGGKP